MPKIKTNPKNIEQREYRIFNPETIKNTTEIAVKPKPIGELDAWETAKNVASNKI